jgi:hypothetical protein
VEESTMVKKVKVSMESMIVIEIIEILVLIAFIIGFIAVIKDYE